MAPLDDHFDPLDPRNRARIREQADADRRGVAMEQRKRDETTKQQKRGRLQIELKRTEMELHRSTLHAAEIQHNLTRIEQEKRLVQSGTNNADAGKLSRTIASEKRELKRLEAELLVLEREEADLERQLALIEEKEKNEQKEIKAIKQGVSESERELQQKTATSLGSERMAKLHLRHEHELKRELDEEIRREKLLTQKKDDLARALQLLH